jgi:membrane protease YdiL (CAAX protease family)
MQPRRVLHAGDIRRDKAVLIVSESISTILQVLIFTAIPFFVYLLVYHRVKGFFDYIGLRRPESRTMLYATLLAIAFVLPALLLLFFSPSIREVIAAPNTVIGKLRSYGFSGTTVVVLCLSALIHTALSEEILFRGFIAKRLINWLGFRWGNMMQALIFGLIHLLLFFGQRFSLPLAVGIVIYTGLGGWAFGYLNERKGNGSILPSWWMHGLTNLITYSVVVFS